MAIARPGRYIETVPHPYHHLFQSLIRYKYAVILPLAVLEGPMVTVVSGILVARGVLGFFPTLAVVLLGDLVSDPALYMIGRFGRGLLHRFPIVKVPPARLKLLEHQYARHPWKTVIAGKLSYGLGSVFVIATGASHMPWGKFAKYMGTVDLIKSTTLLTLGFFSGRAILRMSGYAGWYAAAVLLLPAGYWFVHRKRRAAYS